MSKARNTGNLNNSIQISSTGNITFVNGDATLMEISSSGAIITTGVISGSDAANAISASYALTSSFASVATSASFASNAATATSASQAQNSNTAITSSFAANANLLDSKDSTEFATTGSNNFVGIQYVSSTSNPNGFGASASMYTDGGLRVTKDAYVSGTMYVNNLSVFGTQSINYITSSQLNISTNIISVNTDTPFVRFGGLSVYDSGSTGLTGSILWDSERDHWVYSNPSGSSYNSGMLISGPRNSGSLGTEQGTLNNVIVKGQGGDHVTSSQMIDDGTTVRIPGNLQVTGSVVLSSALSGTSATFSDKVNINADQGAFRLYNLAATLAGGIGTGAWVEGIATTDIAIYSANNLKFYSGNSSTAKFTIASTGAATFSSTVTAGGLLDLNSNTTPTSLNDKFALGVNGSSYAWLQSFGGRPIVLNTSGNNVGIGASIAPVYKLEVSTAGGSERIRVGTLQNNNNTARFEAITSNGVSVANSAWLRVTPGGGFILGQSNYTKAGGDSGNFANLSAESESNFISVASNGSATFIGNLAINNTLSSPGNLIETAGLNVYLRPSSGNKVFIDTGAGLSVSGTINATDLILQGSTNLNYSYTTNSSWASGFQTIIPIQGAQSSGAVYLVRVNWGGGGSPYVVYGAFLWVCMGSNGGGVDNTITPMISTHQGGAGTMNFRNIAGGGQVASGIQVQLIGFADPNGGLGVTATRLM
jgi:hypothetical protein